MTHTGKICIVPGCTNNSTNRPDLTFHIFTKSRKSLMIWLRNLNMMELKDKPYSWLHNKFICADHFDVSQYSYPGSKKLNRNAIPKNIHECQVHIDFNGSAGLCESPIIMEPVAGPSYIKMATWSPPENIEESSNASNETVEFVTLTEKIPEKSSRRETGRDSRLLIVKKVMPLIRRRLASGEALMKSRDLSEFQSDRLYQYLNKIGQMNKRIQIYFEAHLKKIKRKNVPRQFSTTEKAFLLALQYENPTVYAYMSKIFGLPQVRNLQKAVPYITQSAGIDGLRFWYLNEASERKEPEDRYCVLLFDEIPLRPQLYYNMKEDLIEGFEDFGTERGCKIVNSCYLFMIRGLAQRWKQPIAYYFVHSTTKIQDLKISLLQVIQAVHSKTKFRIMASISDISATNRCAISDLCESQGGSHDFIYNVDDHDIIHIFDPPHMLKSLRNSLIKQDIVYDGDRIAKWSDILLLYDSLSGIPFGKVTKLTKSHIFPQGRLKFKVNLAAEVFSRHTYTFLMYGSNLNGAMQAHDTADFVLLINDLFDSLNSDLEGTGRLTQPLSDVSYHIKFWNETIDRIKTWTFFSEDDKHYAPFAFPFLICTITNIQLLWFRMRELGFKFLRTKVLNLDPLENILGVIRLLSKSKRIPTCSQFLIAYHLSVINTALEASAVSNCKNDGDAFLLPLQTYLPNSAAPSELFSQRASTYDKNFNNFVANIKLQTSSYLAGYLCRNVLKLNCSSCVHSFLSTKCTDSHTSIPFRGVNQERVKLYPTHALIAEIDRLKTKLLEIIPKNLHLENVLSSITEIVETEITSQCEEHGTEFLNTLVATLSYSMIKNFLTRINDKLMRKETKPVKVIDEYLARNWI